MLTVGLTGGIASGKTLVSEQFAALGVPIVDADVAAREVVVPGSEGLRAVVEAFGPAVTAPDGSLDRAALRRRIFDDEAARRALEEILHPRIRTRMHAALSRLRDAGHAYCVEAVPLLVETSQYAHCDRVLVVDAPEAIQVQRLLRRDGGTTAQARAILTRQAPRWDRIRLADDVIANGDDVAPAIALGCQIAGLDRKYRLLAAVSH